MTWTPSRSARLGALFAVGILALTLGLVAPAAQAQKEAVLTLDKAGVPDPVAAGGQLTYTLTYANTGGADATNAVLVDPLPDHTSFVSVSGGGFLSGNLVLWNLGTVAAGTGGSVTLVVRAATPLANGTLIDNSATFSSDQTEPLAASSENTVSSAPQLMLAKTASPEPVAAGGLLTYTLAYSNTGSDQATGAALSDTLPANTSFVSASGAGSYDSGTNTVTWSLGTVATGTGGSVTLVVRVDGATPGGTSIQNIATFTAAGQPGIPAGAGSTVVSVPPIAQVPALGGPGLALLALLLAGAGWLRLARRPGASG